MIFTKFCDQSTFLKKEMKMFLKRCAHARGKSWKFFSKIETIFSPYMHPICALYTLYMHPIWRTYLARARARARAPGPRRRGASGPYPQKRVKLFPHARAPANGFLSQFRLRHFSDLVRLFCSENDQITEVLLKFLKSSCFLAPKKAAPIVDIDEVDFQAKIWKF